MNDLRHLRFEVKVVFVARLGGHHCRRQRRVRLVAAGGNGVDMFNHAGIIVGLHQAQLGAEAGCLDEQILIRYCGDENEGGRGVLAEVQRPRVPQNADAVQLRQPDIDNGNIRVIAADFQKSILTVLGDVHIPVSGAEEIFLQKVSLFDIFIGD